MLYNSNLLIANVSSAVADTMYGKPGDAIYSFNQLCIFTNVLNITDNIESASVFCIDILFYSEFIQRVDFREMFPRQIVNKINKTKLVINHVHEANHCYTNNYAGNMWNQLIIKLQLAGIDIERVVFISGDVNIKNTYKKYNNPVKVKGIDIFEYFLIILKLSRVRLIMYFH